MKNKKPEAKVVTHPEIRPIQMHLHRLLILLCETLLPQVCVPSRAFLMPGQNYSRGRNKTTTSSQSRDSGVKQI